MSRSPATARKPAPAIDEFAVVPVPISDCSVAPENPRAHRDTENIEAMRASIAASLADGGPGVLQAGICYEEDGEYFFTAGRRRLDGARAAGMVFFPAAILPKDAAIRAGLLEQENHVAMHPADQAKAFARELALPGATHASVANAYGVSEAVVRQRAALATLADAVFEAFAQDEIDLRTAQAWANAPKERQEAVAARIGTDASLWTVRQHLAEGSLDSDDRLALLVGEEAYRAAGGEIEQDLFTVREDYGFDDEDESEPVAPPSRWTNRELAEQLGKEKIDAKVADLKADGWGWVETGDRMPYGKFDKRPAPKKKVDRAEFGCFVEIRHDGTLNVEKALVVIGSQRGANGQPTKGDAPKPDIGNPAHLVLTTAATRAVQHNLCDNPQAALPILLARLAREHFTDEGFFTSGDEIVGLTGRQHDGAPRDIKIGGQKLWDDLRDSWKAKLAGRWNTAEVSIAKWPQREQLAFLAFLTAATLSGIEGTAADYNSEIRRYRLAFAGRLAGLGEGSDRVSPADTWTPDAKWFAGCSKAYREQVATILEVDNGPNTKVAALCAMLADKADLLGWMPPLMRKLTGCIDVPPPAESEDDDENQTDLEDFTSDAPSPGDADDGEED